MEGARWTLGACQCQRAETVMSVRVAWSLRAESRKPRRGGRFTEPRGLPDEGFQELPEQAGTALRTSVTTAKLFSTKENGSGLLLPT